MKEPLLPVEEALARVLASAGEPMEEESVRLSEAFGRTLARDIVARRTQPPFANSAMDGYGVRAADCARAPSTLRVIGESAAGRAFKGTLGAGGAVRIFTGAPMPAGADAVVVQEDTRREGDTVIVATKVKPGENIRISGLDFVEGETLARAGTRLTPRSVALAAAAHHPDLFVRRQPRVAILATGDELVEPGETIGPSQIVASNNFFIAGLVEACGGTPVDIGIAIDEPGALAAKIAAARKGRADVLVTLGGASVGDYDLVQKALSDAGMELGFWRIAMRPGKPLMHGRLAGMRVLGLPGNPTSSAVCGVLFLRPLLRALLGDPSASADPSEPARLAAALPANGARQDYVRATLAPGADGDWLATALPDQDSSLVKMLARADALIVRPIGAPPAEAGEACRVIPLEVMGA
jgi:molybdopterin molybdotransferase